LGARREEKTQGYDGLSFPFALKEEEKTVISVMPKANTLRVNN
jgi:hypothetical protein